MRKEKKFKKGAASFYIVAFSMLILMIIATSFAAVIISEITRTSNDDLSQSAYDSAMAGIEDAKLAFYNYQNCKAQNISAAEPDNDGSVTCGEIIWYVEQKQDCNMVSNILGRGGDAVVVQESNISNNMQQSYTCVEMTDSLSDYRSTLSSSTMMKVMKAKFDGVAAADIKKVKISWYTDSGVDFRYSNFNGQDASFPAAINASTPPIITLAMLQTAREFDLSDFDMTKGQTTDRGMIYLVPTNDEGKASSNKDSYIGAYNGSDNVIDKNGFLNSNDKTNNKTTVKIKPYVVYCPNRNELEGRDFVCSATVTLPEPVGGDRNDDTFVFAVGLPYGKPVTDFSLEFFCSDGATSCGKQSSDSGAMAANQASLKGVQLRVDSTGRANDLFRRVETRLENSEGFALSIMGPLELLGKGDTNGGMKKDYAVTREWNFED